MDHEGRIKKLERTIEQQCYFIWALGIVVILLTAGILCMWNEMGVPNFDHIGASLAIFQTLFGIAALYGFWALRGLTKEKAEEVAEQELRKIAPPIIRRLVDEAQQAYSGDTPISDRKVEGMMDGLDRKEGENGE